MRMAIGIVLLVHGLITIGIAAGSFARGPGVANPTWLAWWPVALGRSWALDGLRLGQSPAATAGALLWLVGGIALVAAGLGVFGILVPVAWWRVLAVGGAAVSLLALLLYLHPYFVLSIGINAAILAALLWARWPAAGVAGI
jgi:hypothetical protein